MSEDIVIPVEQIEEVAPGVYRIEPTTEFRAWARRQGEIKIE